MATWRYFLGGSVGGDSVRAVDVDGDGVMDLVIATGGRVTVRHDDDSLVWQSPLLDMLSMPDIVDLNGDGILDVVIRMSYGIVLLNGKTGAIEWDSRSWKGQGTAIGYPGFIRIADLDGDGVPDLYIPVEWCGSPGNNELRDAVAFSFANGASFDAPHKLFDVRRDPNDVTCGDSDALIDVDGDGHLEVIRFSFAHLYAYSSVDGSLKYSTNLGTIADHVQGVDSADLNGDGKKDLVLYIDNVAATSASSRRVVVVGFHQVNGQAVFEMWWQHAVADLANDRNGFADTSLMDVDGDGKLEVTSSFFSGMANQWTLHVWDALTGTEKASQADSGRLVGSVDLDGAGTIGILTNYTGNVLRAYTMQGGTLSLLWSYSGLRTIGRVDYALARVQSAAHRILTVDACGDTRPELPVFELDANQEPATIAAYQTSPNASVPRCPNAYDVRGTGESFLAAIARPDGKLSAGRSTGILSVLAFQNGVVALPAAGAQFGGYYSGAFGRQGPTPIAPAIAASGPTPILIPDSRGFLEAIDASAATLVTNAAVRWSAPGLQQVSAFDLTGKGMPQVIGWRRNAIVELDAATGNELHSFQVAPPDSPSQLAHFDVLAMSVGTTKGLVYQILDLGSGDTDTGVIDAFSGMPLWPATFDYSTQNCNQVGTSLADLNGDGTTDVITGACEKLAGLDGGSGMLLPGRLADSKAATMGLVYDVDGDGILDVTSTGGQLPIALKRDFTPLWQNSDIANPDMYYHYTAVAKCDAGVRYAVTDDATPDFYILDGATGATVNGMAGSPGIVPAEGAVFPSVDAAIAAGKRAGHLGNVTAAQDLRGPHTPTFLFGSTDGFLYAFDACTGALAWALDLGAPVGQPILADARGSGHDQIVVSVADGYLYGIDQELFPAPAWVKDVDPLHGHPDDQVATIVTTDTLWAEWSPVAGADHYECAVITGVDTIVTSPPFVNCGSGTTNSISGLPLVVGQTYRQAVRAVGPAGTSVETFSRGVQVVAPGGDGGVAIDGGSDGSAGAPPTGGCSCEVARARSTAPAWSALVLLAIALGRRSVRRRRRS
ncbi:MAG TPA: VCBS repeat-containing protein [Polyangiaceae bacterium]|nr:VCBS repeat-containing protein [Polyangiaceae bacterium]